MNIVIDQGNTSIKLAVFDGKTLLKTSCFNTLTRDILLSFLCKYRLEAGILCSVAQWDYHLTDYLKAHVPTFLELNEHIPLPLTVDYQTLHTLGADRIAAAVGAYRQKPDENLLVIDIGTAITIDFINKNGQYKGGNISPGPDLRFKALHDYTHRLPLLNEKGDIPVWGYDTATAIRAGVIDGIAREIDSYLEEYKKKHNVSAFLTGGYAFYFESKLKNPTFADENLVLKGLNEILEYQKIKK